MNEGILFGLAAAVCFGISDTIAALSSRRIGAIPTAVGVMVFGFVSLTVFAVFVRPKVPADMDWALPVVALGVLTGFAYLCLVNALRLGPISIVSPLGGSSGAVTVAIAVIFLGDRPRLQEWVALGVTTAGAITVALVRTPGARLRIGSGPAFAGLAVIGYAISITGLQSSIRAVGWLPTLVVWRAASLVVTTAVFGFSAARVRRGDQAVSSGDFNVVPAWLFRRMYGLPVALVLAGFLESAGQILRSFGLAVAPVWLVGIMSPLATIVVISAGVVLFGERLSRAQILGNLLVGMGLVLLALP